MFHVDFNRVDRRWWRTIWTVVFTFPSETHTAWVCWSRMVSFKLPYQASLAEFRSITAIRPMGEGQRERKSKHFHLGQLFSRFNLTYLSHSVSISCLNHLEIFELESVSKSVYIDMCQLRYMVASLYCTSP